MLVHDPKEPLPKFSHVLPMIYVLGDEFHLLAYVRDWQELRRCLNSLGIIKLRRVRFLPDTPPNHWLREAYGSYLEFWGLASAADLQYDGSWYKGE